jgi:hypothetical protein
MRTKHLLRNNLNMVKIVDSYLRQRIGLSNIGKKYKKYAYNHYGRRV